MRKIGDSLWFSRQRLNRLSFRRNKFILNRLGSRGVIRFLIGGVIPCRISLDRLGGSSREAVA